MRAQEWVLARAALTALLIVALAVACGGAARLGAPGRSLFVALVFLDFVFLTAIAIGPFASALAEEKEGDTLGVLRLAGLTPTAIVGAKAGGLLASTLLLLLIQVPLAILATTLGGVSGRQVIAAFVTLVCYTIAAQGIALACAARANTPKGAGHLVAWILSTWLLLPTALASLLTMVGYWTGGAGGGRAGAGSSRVQDALDLLHLVSPFSVAFAGLERPSPPLTPIVVWICLALAPIAFALAVLSLGQKRVASSPESRRHLRRPRPLGLRTLALVWKEENFLLGGRAAMRRRTIGYGVIWLALGVLTYDPRGGWFGSWGTVGVQVFLLAALLEAGVAASHLYRDEVRDRTLFGLALLPVPPATWAMGKARGALRALRAPTWPLAASCAWVVLGRPALIVPLPIALMAWFCLGALVVNGTLFLSLWLPRGAFPAAAAAVLIPSGIFAWSPAIEVACCFFYVAPVTVLVVVSWLQVAIGRRLRLLAARG